MVLMIILSHRVSVVDELSGLVTNVVPSIN